MFLHNGERHGQKHFYIIVGIYNNYYTKNLCVLGTGFKAWKGTQTRDTYYGMKDRLQEGGMHLQSRRVCKMSSILTLQQLSIHELDEPQDWVEIDVVDKDERWRL